MPESVPGSGPRLTSYAIALPHQCCVPVPRSAKSARSCGTLLGLARHLHAFDRSAEVPPVAGVLGVETFGIRETIAEFVRLGHQQGRLAGDVDDDRSVGDSLLSPLVKSSRQPV